MIRRACIFLLCCFQGAAGWAVDNDKSALLLQAVSDRLAVAEVTRGKFIQLRHLKVLSRPLISRGNFVFHRQSGVRWAVIEPFPSVMIANASGVSWQGEQAQPLTAGFGQLLRALLTLDVEQLQRNFEISGDPDGDEWRLVLTPRNQQWKKAIAEIQLRGSEYVSRVDVQEAKGDSVRVQFTEIRFQPLLSAQERRELLGE